MRYSRVLTAIILTSALIVLFSVNVFAAGGETQKLIVDYLEAEYKDANYRLFTPTVSRDSYIFPTVPRTITVDSESKSLITATILSYGSDSVINWENGYIYTFNFSLQVAGVDETNAPSFTLGIATLGSSGISDYVSVGSCTYNYTTASNMMTFNITSVVNVDSNFNKANFEDYSRSYIALTISDLFLNAQANITVLASSFTSNKSIGQDSYYQASIDAIKDLPQASLDAEYNYCISHLPDDEGTIQTIQGDIDEILLDTKNELNGVNQLLESFDYNEPLVYMPNINIPLGDGVNINVDSMIHSYVDSNGYFHPLTMATEMSPTALGWINTGVLFIRFVAIISFLSFAVFKMLRLEWWIHD